MTSKSQRKSAINGKTHEKSFKTRVQSSWIIVIKDSLLENDNFKIITLMHPKSGLPTKYCLDNVNNKIFEVVTFSEPYRSWFIGETVKSDGSLMFITPMNPIFLVLPKLIDQCSDKAVPMEDLLSDKGFDNILDYVKDLDNVADSKGPPELKAYKFNEEKTLLWLKKRVEKLSQVLQERNVHVTSGAISATFVASSVSAKTIDKEFYLKYAYGMLSEYIQDNLAEKLGNLFNFREDLIEHIGKKRKSEVIGSDESHKKAKTESEEYCTNDSCLQNLTSIKKSKSISAKEKARQKAASGTKTISSFFAKNK